MRSPLCTISSARGGTSFRFSTFSQIHLFLRLLQLFPPISLQHRRLLKRFRILDISFPLLLLLPDLNGLIISSFPVKRKKGEKSENISAELDKVWVERFFADQTLHADEEEGEVNHDDVWKEGAGKRFGRIG